MRSACHAASLIVLAAFVTLLPSNANGGPLYTQDVFCNTTKCGTMELDKYETAKANEEFASKYWLGGVRIHGTFEPAKDGDFHYVQSYKTNADDLRWFRDTSVALPQPFLDPPPGGYKVRADATDNDYTAKQPFDYLPWYDQVNDPKKFPDFSDSPRNLFLSAKNQADHTLTTTFETWLVCVIEEMQGPNADQAKDDSYKVAPLLGWQWGYDIVYKDADQEEDDRKKEAEQELDELADFTVIKRDVAFVMTPTAHWTDALKAKYGATGQDFWNITTGPCDSCSAVPEPAIAVLLLMGMPLIALRRWRRDHAATNL